ncbi:FKBP-type peptidyl-prolyl cis-trans isomerase [Nocardioides jiangxiensis]|uniref:Peptidyl-prolyl cis-trans isomerase n=1 Tax=Nocardioides jiangxiensis TaxID=3064524 RepID=A0ABT9AWL3_9ACTN|nr:FKBP-type peptidyl-prolyl cis-trans isomerase [Nocardioides sp. WY-20]MDO7866839.1 FKBP-type peptidyl-prolyl cis-trans isomerase [Nocardioides sp. WY-20]
MRRLVVTSTVLALSTAGLAACGGTDSTDTGKVTVSGAFGTAPKVTYDGTLVREKTEVKVLSKGDGPTVAAGDSVSLDMYIGDGYTGAKAFSTFDEGESPSSVTADDNTLKAIKKAVVGATVGSRIEVIAAPDDTWGPAGGNSSLNIGNKDTTVFVIDIIKKVGPKDVDRSAVPKLFGKGGGVPAGFDFSASPKKPSTDLLRATLKPGTGEPIKAGQTVKVKYLGSVYGSSKVFDETFSKGRDPISVTVGSGGVIQGWDLGLVGAKVGSRIELVIPADLGYGAQAKGTDIPANSTLVFVMDIVSGS